MVKVFNNGTVWLDNGSRLFTILLQVLLDILYVVYVVA